MTHYSPESSPYIGGHSYDEILTRRELQRIIEKMPDVHKACLRLKYVHRFTNKEIAGLFGRSEGAVESIIVRTKKKIRREMGV